MSCRVAFDYRSDRLQKDSLACSSVRSTVPYVPPSTPPDEEDLGIADPFLDDLLLPIQSNDQPADEGPLADVPIGLLPEPTDLESTDEGKLGPDLAESFRFEDDTLAHAEDNEQGPTGTFDWGALDTLTGSESDDPDDGPIENQTLPLEPLKPLSSDVDQDEAPISTRLPVLQIDDVELPWAKERWAELPLRAAFSARHCLALVGTTLCVGGEATHLLSARHFDAIEDAPLPAKTQRVIGLDAEAQRLLLLTTTGQLVLWRRNPGGDGQTQKIPVPHGEIVSMIWQLAPGVPNLLIRLESGRLFQWDDKRESLTPLVQHADGLRLRAISEIGEPRVTLWQGHNHAHLCAEVGTEKRQLALTPSMERAIADSYPLLAGFVDHVLLGVRDHGLFLRGPGNSEFAVVPGCRRLTALAVGHMLQRPTAFVGLFSELEDRTEIVAVDLTTARASRVAELSILTDDAGPEDDPPERARVDALLWDPSQLRLWSAGCFGLACFCPPSVAATS
jgi:hypothetical protein